MTFYAIRALEPVPVFRGIAERMLRPVLTPDIPVNNRTEPDRHRRGSIVLAIVREKLRADGAFSGLDMSATVSPTHYLPELAAGMATPTLTFYTSGGGWREYGPRIRDVYLDFLRVLHYTPEQVAAERERFRHRERPGYSTGYETWGEVGSTTRDILGHDTHFIPTGAYGGWSADSIMAHPAMVLRTEASGDRSIAIRRHTH